MKIDDIGGVRMRGRDRNQRANLAQEVAQVILDLEEPRRSQKALGKETTDTNQTI
jgi:hypothetical protein